MTVLDGFTYTDDGWLVAPDGTRLRAIAGGGGSAPKIPPPPGPTPQEIAIQEQQVAVLKQQVTALERQNEINAAVPASEIAAAQRDQISVAREQLALMKEEVARARARGPREEAFALHQLAVAEQQLRVNEQQLTVAQRGMKLQEALQPFVLRSMRLVEEPGVGIRRMTEDEFKAALSPQERLAYDNTTLALEREAKALKGELPLSEAGQQRKRDEFLAFKEQMARGGNSIAGDAPGSATATTTAGVQSLKAFNERWGLVEEAERRGELTAGGQSVLARLGVASDIGVRRREGLLSAVPPYQIPGFAGGGGRGVTGVTSGMGIPQVGLPAYGALSPPDFAGILAPYQQRTALAYDRNKINAQLQANAQAAEMQGYGQLTGALFGAGATIGAAVIASSRDKKKDIRRATRKQEDRALAMVKDLDAYTFRYKGESKNTPKRMGMMADRVPAEIATPDRKAIDAGRLVGMLTAATRALARRDERRV